jgi:hypothetical protein
LDSSQFSPASHRTCIDFQPGPQRFIAIFGVISQGKRKNMATAKIDRSLLQGESFELFSAAIKSPATQDPYERKSLGFLKENKPITRCICAIFQ